MSLRLSLTTVALISGCVTSTDDTEISETVTELAEGGCTTWGCGTNSPVFQAVSFHELSELGVPNLEGYRIASFRKDSFSPERRINVSAGQILAQSLQDGSIVASGLALENWQLIIKHESNGSYYRVRIADVAHSKATPFWHNPNHLEVFPWTYKFEWQTGNMTWWEEVCGNPDGFSQDGLADFHAVVFESDRVDATAKRVYADDASWFNIGCGGHALAKQHLTGHTRSAARVLQIPTPSYAVRTAHLKALVADYCGTGDVFTVAGERLAWTSSNGFSNYMAWVNAGTEAVWTDAGAACLNTPRIEWNNSSLGNATFPDSEGGVEAAIAQACRRPPTCTSSYSGSVTTFLKYAYVAH